MTLAEAGVLGAEAGVLGAVASGLGVLAGLVQLGSLREVSGILFGLAPPFRLVWLPRPALLYSLVATAAVLVGGAWPAWRMAKAHASTQGTLDVPSADRTSRIVEEATRAGAPASAAVGIRLALEPGRGRTAVPVRSALAGTVLAVAAVAAAFTFGSNLVRLVHTPKLYGQTWTLAVDTQFGRLPPDKTVAFLEKQQGVTGWTTDSNKFAGQDALE